MPKAFKKRIWNGYINGTQEVTTGAEHDELLGRADDISYQVNLENMDDVASVRVQHHVSNDGGKNFVLHSTPVNDVAVSGTADQKVGSTTGVNGDLARATIKLTETTTNPSAYAELWACGRTD